MIWSPTPGIRARNRPLATPVMLRAALGYAQEHGADVTGILHDVGLSSDVIEDDDTLIDCGKIADALELVARATGMPDFGLRFGQQMHPGKLGALGPMVMHARTVSDALRDIGRFVHLVNESISVSVERRIDCYQVRVACAYLGVYGTAQHNELVMTSVIQACRVLLGAGWHPLQVAFRHAPVSETSTYQSVLGCPVVFNAQEPCFRARVEDLERVLSTGNEYARSGPEPDLRERQQARAVDLVIRAEAALRGMVPMGRSSIGDLAKALGMTERTLQRRLGEQGSSFRQVLMTARRAIVRRNAEKGRSEALDLCVPLGFSEASAVNRFLREHCNDVWPSPGGRGKARTDDAPN